METLNEAEERLVRHLLDWDETCRPFELIIYNLLLVLGGAVIVVSGLFTIQHLSDRTAVWILVPSFLLGILLIVLYLIGIKRIKERRIVASTLRKLMG